MALEFTEKNFSSEVESNEGISLVDFWATWCGPCRAIAPTIEAIAKEYEGKVKVGKVDVDHNPDISMKYGIRNIPTLLIFKDGKIVDKHVGAVTKPALIKKLENHLAQV